MYQRQAIIVTGVAPQIAESEAEKAPSIIRQFLFDYWGA